MELGWVSNVAAGVVVSELLEDGGRPATWHDVSGLALGGKGEWGPWSLIGRYVASLEEYDPAQLGFAGHGARPWAAQAELAYNTELWQHKSMVILGWQASGEARALDLPRGRLLAGMRTELLPHVSLAVEYRHDEEYATEDDGNGNGADAVIGRLILELAAKQKK